MRMVKRGGDDHIRSKKRMIEGVKRGAIRPKKRMVKRGYGDLVRLKKNKITRSGEETSESLIAGDMHWDSNQGLWGELHQEVASNSSKSVVSLAVSDGTTELFACSGIAIECHGYVTRLLTSASLVRALNDKTEGRGNLKVEVCHEGNAVIGFLENYDLDYGIAVVKVMTLLDVQVVLLNHLLEFLPYSEVVAVGRAISGKLMATSGKLIPYSSGFEDSKDLMMSTCKISETCIGGPLFDIEGNFVGMNLIFVEERTLFLPTILIFERLEHFRMSMRISKFIARLENFSKASSVGKVLTKRGDADLSRASKKDKRTGDLTRSKKNKRADDLARSLKKYKRTDDLANSSKKNKRTCNGGKKTTKLLIEDVLNEDPFWDLDSLGYPKLPKNMLNDDGILTRTFEDTFGDISGGGIWNELGEAVSSNISQNVASLASFYGEKRIFACTGFFIEWNGCATILTSASLVSDFVGDNKIAENLRIEVLLPNNKRREGTLQHYNLNYNVALVSVKDFSAPYPASIQYQRQNFHVVVAVGRCFESGILMAASGRGTELLDGLGCKLLQFSTCVITKAGIGGPLLDSDGIFIGMNFYDMESTKTPFLPRNVILDVLTYFKTKRTVAEVGHDVYSSGALDWTIDGDSSASPDRWCVPDAVYCHPKNVRIFCKRQVRHPRELLARPTCRIGTDGKKYLFN